MTKHPSYGAAYLINIEGIIRIAPIVAFEHHRKFNGKGYPVLAANGKNSISAVKSWPSPISLMP